jgi:hypothetical protein
MKKSKRIEENFISKNPDMLPVILTCPHNGEFVPVGVPIRKKSKSPSKCQTNFRITGDLHTQHLRMKLRTIFTDCAKKMCM